MTTITHAAGTIAPEVVNGYEATREVRTIVHTIMNRPDPDIAFRAPGRRRGILTCVFAVEADARDAYGVFSEPQLLALTDPDVPTVAMTFVVAGGDLVIRLDDETRSVWLVDVPFQEVEEAPPVPGELVIIDGIVQATP